MRLGSRGIQAVGRQVHASSPAANQPCRLLIFSLPVRISSIRLIALTAYGSPEDRQRAFRSGFESHLTKPASIEQLSLALTTE
jgi:CheY-like chemotaxis protein